jgi:hypothetical protein
MNLKQAQASAAARGLPKSVHGSSTHVIVNQVGGVVEGWASQEYADAACARLNGHSVQMFGEAHYHVEELALT